MIALRPSHVFETPGGALEQALLAAATAIIAAFERIVVHLAAGRVGEAELLLSDFQPTLFEYLRRFQQWKVPDEAKLSLRIKHALIALCQAQAHLPPDEPADSRLSAEFRQQIARLRSKLVQIAGQAELDRFDERQRASASAGDALPPPLQGGGGANHPSSARVTNEQLAHELLIDPAFQLSDDGSVDDEGAGSVLRRIRESFHQVGCFDVVSVFCAFLSDSFSSSSCFVCSLSFSQAFWDSLADDLRLDSPCFVRVLRVLREVRDGLVDLAAQRACVVAQVSELIDLEHIGRQAELGIYGWDSCMGLVAGVTDVVRRMQAPRRDAETRSLWAVVDSDMRAADGAPDARAGALCRALAFLLGRINMMRIDAANAR
jgi:hypothetical protein